MITNYTTLKSTVADWLNRSDLTAAIPVMIQLAEATFKRGVSVDGVGIVPVRTLVVEPIELSDGEMPLPDGCVAPLALQFTGAASRYGKVTFVPQDELGALAGGFSATGVPVYASVHGDPDTGLWMRLVPAPAEPYEASISYWKTIEPLSDTNPTNWLLDNHPDLYLFAVLAEAEPYLKEDPRVDLWVAKRNGAVLGRQRSLDRARFGGTIGGRRPRRVIG